MADFGDRDVPIDFLKGVNWKMAGGGFALILTVFLKMPFRTFALK